MSFFKLNGGARATLLALAVLVSTCHPALANTITLECSYDGFPNRASFTVDINKNSNTVTTNSPGENLGNTVIAAHVSGPYPAVINDKAISWHWQNAYQQSGDVKIDRVTGKALDTMQLGSETARVAWSCHAAQNKF